MVSNIITNGRKFLGRNSHTILTGTAVVGVIGTAIMASRDTIQANDRLLEYRMELDGKPCDKKELVKRIAPCYIPTALTVGATITAIVGAHQTATHKIIAYSSAYTMAQEAATIYRDKVHEIVGEKKAKEIEAAVAKDQITKSKDDASAVVIGDGNVLCMDGFSGRFFPSTLEKIRKAQNDVNYKMNAEMYASLNDFYEALDLPYIGCGDDLGWTSEHPIELSFSTTLTPDGKPALVVNFHESPMADYRNLI